MIAKNEKLQARINELRKKQAENDSNINKRKEQIDIHQRNKEFLDDLNGSNKQAAMRKKTQRQRRATQKKQAEKDANTFMTKVEDGAED